MNPVLHMTFAGTLFAIIFASSMSFLLLWMFRLPPQFSRVIAKVRISYGAIKTILVPITGTFYSDKAIELACRLGKEQQANIVLTYILEIPMNSPLNVAIPEAEAKAQEILDNGAQLITAHKMPHHVKIQRARTAGAGIIQAARDEEADLMVVGVKPKFYGESPSMLGTTANWLLQNAPCEIVIDKLASV